MLDDTDIQTDTPAISFPPPPPRGSLLCLQERPWSIKTWEWTTLTCHDATRTGHWTTAVWAWTKTLTVSLGLDPKPLLQQTGTGPKPVWDRTSPELSCSQWTIQWVLNNIKTYQSNAYPPKKKKRWKENESRFVKRKEEDISFVLLVMTLENEWNYCQEGFFFMWF